MHDQATTLRHLAATRNAADAPSIFMNTRTPTTSPLGHSMGARAVAITGGKGGVGKSNIAVNLALALAARGRRVTILDADLALANDDVLLGLNPVHHLGHVLNGSRSLAEIAIEVEDNVRLIPGGSGVEELANLAPAQHARLVAELRAMELDSDYLLVDTAAGVAGNVMGVLRAVSEAIIVTTPDPTAIVDAYATIKLLHRHAPATPLFIVVNNVVGVGDAEQIFQQLNKSTMRFLRRQLDLLGTIPCDPELAEAVRERTPVMRHAPGAPASRALRLLAKHLDERLGVPPPTAPAPSFSDKLLTSFD